MPVSRDDEQQQQQQKDHDLCQQQQGSVQLQSEGNEAQLEVRRLSGGNGASSFGAHPPTACRRERSQSSGSEALQRHRSGMALDREFGWDVVEVSEPSTEDYDSTEDDVHDQFHSWPCGSSGALCGAAGAGTGRVTQGVGVLGSLHGLCSGSGQLGAGLVSCAPLEESVELRIDGQQQGEGGLKPAVSEPKGPLTIGKGLGWCPELGGCSERDALAAGS